MQIISENDRKYIHTHTHMHRIESHEHFFAIGLELGVAQNTYKYIRNTDY